MIQSVDHAISSFLAVFSCLPAPIIAFISLCLAILLLVGFVKVVLGL